MTTIADATEEELDAVLAAARSAAGPFAAERPAVRAGRLRSVADALDAAADVLVPLAEDESHLPEVRLRGELARTTFQIRFLADVLEDGSYLEAIIDTADPDAQPTPRPEVRRQLHPLGPVLVFAASNFPFAFSVAGGDTASALAAGCPVVLKAHPGHPELSRRTGDIVSGALREAGAPEGSFQVVFGLDAGRQALLDPRVRAGAFTGSVGVGRALFDLAASRAEPIPFYGELGSLNPVFVTPSAVEARGAEIVRGYVASFTMGVGQFCTKPGLLFLPRGHGLVDELAEQVRQVPAAPMLNDRIRSGYQSGLESAAGVGGVRVVVGGEPTGDLMAPTLVTVSVPDLLAAGDSLLTECFGPMSIVVEYDGDEQALAAAEAFEGNLTATLHTEDGDPVASPLLERLRERAGRLICNGWPTGVSVTWGMHHGGPYPATTAPLHTSVGGTAIGRFLRPVCYQNVPQALLPEALRDANQLGIPRRVNGTMTSADVAGT
ncbi:MAG: aldehyde dehydrogenase family protein [Propionibacteriales bacterium]|nr:aldehyde dehydrogenase family protein [Propionibacteriales bacterium]